jgi:hypothetical protein
MWVGVHTSKIVHLGATTTQRVEGSHGGIKYILEGGQRNLEEALDRMDRLFERQVF